MEWGAIVYEPYKVQMAPHHVAISPSRDFEIATYYNLYKCVLVLTSSKERKVYMAEFEPDMTYAERIDIHGTQLRMVTDELVIGVDDLETRTEFLLRRAQAIADTAAIRNEIREQLETS